MNGLEFIRTVKEELPYTRFIILSCFDEGDYYRQAIKLGVSEYVLKSMATPEEILEVVNHAAKDILKDRLPPMGGETHDNYNMHGLLCEYMNLVLKGHARDNAEIASRFKEAGIVLHEKYNYVMTLSLNYPGFEKVYCGDYDLTAVSLSHDVIRSMASGFVFLNNEDRICAIVSYHGQLSGEAFVEDICYGIGETVRQCLDMEVSFGVSSAFSMPPEIADRYKQAVEALKRRFFCGVSSVYHWKDKPTVYNTLTSLLYQWKKRIGSVSSLSGISTLEDVLEEIRLEASYGKSMDEQIIRSLYSEVVTQIISLSGQPAGEPEAFILRFIQQAETLDRLHGKVKDFIDMWQKACAKQEGVKESAIVSAIKEYIEGHVSEKISLSKIADHVFLHPNYICRLFKRETGKNLMDYCNERKIERAKELISKGIPLSSIPEALGFLSESYFIRVFKKYTGLTPGNFFRVN